jgi:hypothetical protein
LPEPDRSVPDQSHPLRQACFAAVSELSLQHRLCGLPLTSRQILQCCAISDRLREHLPAAISDVPGFPQPAVFCSSSCACQLLQRRLQLQFLLHLVV